jgi:hypothetical protein
MKSILDERCTVKSPLIAVSATAAMLLSGCFPHARSYVHLSGEEVRQKREVCDLGPRVAVVYSRGEIEFEVSLDPGFSRPKHERHAQVTIKAPERLTLTMPVHDVVFAYRESDTKPPASRIEGAFDVKGRAEPTWSQNGRSTYRLKIVNAPEFRARGSFRLPTIYVDGHAVAQPELTFEPRAYAGVLPLNC